MLFRSWAAATDVMSHARLSLTGAPAISYKSYSTATEATCCRARIDEQPTGRTGDRPGPFAGSSMAGPGRSKARPARIDGVTENVAAWEWLLGRVTAADLTAPVSEDVRTTACPGSQQRTTTPGR